jgi:hypothetical protein
VTQVLVADTTEVVTAAPPAWRTVATLTGRESRLLLRHPAIRVGVALAALGWFALWTAEDGGEVLSDPGNDFPFPVVLLAFALLLAANLGSLRARRAGTEELFESLPMPPARRTLAHLLTSIAGVAFCAVVFALMLVLWQARPGTIGWPSAQLIAVLLFLVAGGIVTGVLVARWTPHAALGAASIVALTVLQSNFGHESEQWQWLHFLPQQFSGVFAVGPVAWHIPYLAGLVVLGGALAVGRHGWTRPVTIALAASLVVIGLGAWVQTRPLEGRALIAHADRIQRPLAHQTCVQHGAVRYCTYPAYADWIREWQEPVEGVRSQLPAGALGRVADVNQRTSWTDELQPSLRSRIDPERAWPADGRVHPGLTWGSDRHHLGLAYQVAAAALGLPTGSTVEQPPCSAGGQARAVVAFWLAGQADPEARRELTNRVADMAKEGRRGRTTLHVANAMPDWANEHSDEGGDWIPELGSGARGADLEAAAALLALTPARVGDVVRANWSTLRDPVTSGVELFELIGATPPAGYAALAPVRPGVGQACA